MEDDVEKWLTVHAEDFLTNIGISNGDTVLDFGCGRGYYTIPAAHLVGRNGKVYALDKREDRLSTVRRKVHARNLSNIEILHTTREINIPLDNTFIDVVLLYDVLHSHYFTPSKRKELLCKIQRIVKSDGLISVYPRHMNTEDVYKEMQRMNFLFEKKLVTTILHNRTLVEDTVLNFKKP